MSFDLSLKVGDQADTLTELLNESIDSGECVVEFDFERVYKSGFITYYNVNCNGVYIVHIGVKENEDNFEVVYIDLQN